MFFILFTLHLSTKSIHGVDYTIILYMKYSLLINFLHTYLEKLAAVVDRLNFCN